MDSRNGEFMTTIRATPPFASPAPHDRRDRRTPTEGHRDTITGSAQEPRESQASVPGIADRSRATAPDATPLHGASRERRAAAERWLYQAAPTPALAAAEWNLQGVALLQAGIAWDVVRVPYPLLGDLGRAVDPGVLRRLLHELGVDGPVFCDPYRPNLYVVVPQGTDAWWPSTLTAAGAECLGGTRPYIRHVGVPRLDRTEPPGPYWLTPPDAAVRLHTDVQHLCRVLRARLAEERP
ncbi:hypothetical protein GCM10010524_39650 [Streptomyces mexicanus]